ncbi:MAG TPA: hypothetical protein VGF79_02680 [Bacteroidia bacterium]
MKTQYTNFKLLIAIFFLVLLSSCGNYVYKPTTIKPALFSGKGDFELSLNTFTLGELHGAVALTDNIAVSYTSAWGFNNSDTTLKYDSARNVISQNIDKTKGKDKEFSIGYYKYLDDGNCFEVFAGMGYYKRNRSIDFTDYKVSSKSFESTVIDNRYRRIFIQPAYGRTGKFFDFSFANRFSFVTYEKDMHSDFISESMFTFRYGYKNVKLMSQIGFTMSNLNSPYDYMHFTFGVGLYLIFNKSFKLN